MHYKLLSICILMFLYGSLSAQSDHLNKMILVTDSLGEPVICEMEIVHQENITYHSTDENGLTSIRMSKGKSYIIDINDWNHEKLKMTISDDMYNTDTIHIILNKKTESYDEVVITGNLRPTMRSKSPVNIEVYNHTFFKSNPQPSLFESLETINGVRPQSNCNVCNTGDIHINGLEGPYTMVLIDGMPIVSGLSTVYGLNGIPTSLIERVEIMKGPASTLYGSEAIGGIINVVTKTVENAPLFSADIMGTTWNEWNMDFATKFSVNKYAHSLIGVNAYLYNTPFDKNNDNFTDVTLQKRISAFNKWQFKRKNNKEFNTAIRYIYEDRWGGEMNWNKSHKGGEDVYGETIETKRFEWMAKYELPHMKNTFLTASYNNHFQNSYYGSMHFRAQQNIFFAQLTHHHTIKNHDILFGATYRYTYYDDNTAATENLSGMNTPQKIHLPGLFIQNEWQIDENNQLLMGVRYDYNSVHQSILTPRLNYKWSSDDNRNILRLGIGNGYRVAYIFTEDHAALTGARDVVLNNDLKPERSWNADLRYEMKVMTDNDFYMAIDFGGFYTYFHNRIIPDYDTHPDQIIYDNLNGYGISRGISMNIDAQLFRELRVNAGWTYMDVFTVEDDVKERQYFTEKFTAAWNINYKLRNLPLSFDYTGNIYSPMRLPLLSHLDPRSPESPWFSIQNVQVTYAFAEKFELYGGVKNILNWTPSKHVPFLIARSHDPFDKNVEFDAQGIPQVTPENPYGLTFDPTYVFASNQGRKMFLGLRYRL